MHLQKRIVLQRKTLKKRNSPTAIEINVNPLGRMSLQKLRKTLIPCVSKRVYAKKHIYIAGKPKFIGWRALCHAVI